MSSNNISEKVNNSTEVICITAGVKSENNLVSDINSDKNDKSLPDCDNSNVKDLSTANEVSKDNVTSDQQSNASPNNGDSSISPTLNIVNEIIEFDKTAYRDSAVILKECDSLRFISAYGDNSSTDDENDKNSIIVKNTDSSDEWDSSSDSSTSCISETSSESEDDSMESSLNNKSEEASKKITKKKNNEENLPPVPDLSKLNINVETEEFMHIGYIDSIIDKLVTISAIPGTPAFDIDSCLFLEDESSSVKKPLGLIDDVLGPVTEPLYCVRFNDGKDIANLNIRKGIKVFAAPKSAYTKYVFVKELMRLKGSDASWKNDEEVPSELMEFSDDELEREARKPKTLKRKQGSLERYQRFEQTMNECNNLHTKVTQLMDTRQHLSRFMRPKNSTQISANNRGQTSFAPVHPAPFNPRVPPPNINVLGHPQTSAPYFFPSGVGNATNYFPPSTDVNWSFSPRTTPQHNNLGTWSNNYGTNINNNEGFVQCPEPSSSSSSSSVVRPL